MFEQAYQFVIEQIGKNDLVAGGAVLGALAFILNYLKSVPFTLLRWSRLAFVTELDISDRSDVFKWVTDWVAEHKYSKRAKRLTVECVREMRERSHSYGSHTEPVGKSKTKVSPAPGTHLVWWKWKLIILRRIRRESTGDNAARMYRESWALTMIGRRRDVEKFLDECREVHERDKGTHIMVMEGENGYWQKSAKRRKRPLDSVLLPAGMKDLLIKDVNEFINSEDWYHEMNIPWRRGYLLTGPPGNGKSSLITAIASEIDFEVCIVNLGRVNEDDLTSMMADMYERSIVLLEDIDCIFEEREAKEGVAVSLSTVLNLLDGVNASEGRIVVMTTNCPDKLDPALIRPGRADLHLNLPNATSRQAGKMFKRFFPLSRNADEFGARVEKLDVSMAKLQGYLLRHRHSMRDARTNIKELLDGEVQDNSRGLHEADGHDVPDSGSV